MSQDVTPHDPTSVLRVSGTSKLAFGATTAALISLASGGTALVVSSSTGAPTATSIPGVAAPDDASGQVDVVVDAPAAVVKDPTERALRDALARRAEPGKRTLTAPLVDLGTRPQPPVDLPLVPVAPVLPVVGPVLPTVPVTEPLPAPGGVVDRPSPAPVPVTQPAVRPRTDKHSAKRAAHAAKHASVKAGKGKHSR